jgi:hypothetical protein
MKVVENLKMEKKMEEEQKKVEEEQKKMWC